MSSKGLFITGFLTLCLLACWPAQALELHLEWRSLPELPRPLSGHFVGLHENHLLVGGGSNFPVSLFEGGEKRWYPEVYSLAVDGATWQVEEPLDHPLAYAAFASTPKGVVVAGGSDGLEHSKKTSLFRWEADRFVRSSLPDLPLPLAYATATALGNRLYVYGGREGPETPVALNTFLSLDLDSPQPKWEELPAPPGKARMLSVLAGQDGAVFLFSGTALIPDASGVGQREYLTDGYRYRPGNGWTRIADAPVPLVAAPTVAFGPGTILAFSGDDGLLVDRIQELKEDHPGFLKQVHGYHVHTDAWNVVGDFPPGLVTTGAVLWNGRMVIPGGEDRPGHRSSEVHSGQLHPDRKGFAKLDYAAILVYFALLVAMGFYFASRENTTEDYFLAGKRIPWWAAGLSIFGTQLSAITFLAIPAKTFSSDWLIFFVNMTIILVAPLVAFFYLPLYRGLNITTAYEYLERRFNLLARLFGSCTFMLFQFGRMGIVLFLPALALSAATEVNIYYCILAMGILSTLYTVLGGIEAVIWTDVAQVFVLVGGALLSLVLIALQVEGGLGAIYDRGREAHKFHMFNPGWDWTLPVVWVVLIGQFCANAVPYTSDQTVVQRYLTTRDEAQAKKAIWTNAVMTFPATLLFCSVGTALYAFYRTHPANLDPTLQTDGIFPLFIVQQLPAGLAGLVVAGIFAASMSSLDSSLNSLATVLVTDFRERLSGRTVRTDEERRKSLFLAKTLTLVLGVVGTGSALILATYPIRSFMDLYLELLGLVGGSLAGLFALGVFSRTANGIGGVVGALAGVATSLLVKNHTDIHFLLFAALSVATCFLTGWVVSFLTGGPRKDLAGLTYWTRNRS
jgi:SSS family transporter